MRLSLITLVLLGASSFTFAADWKPAAAPLMTKWGKKVTPESADSAQNGTRICPSHLSGLVASLFVIA